MRRLPSGKVAALPSPPIELPKKLGRKERARLRAAQQGFVWGEKSQTQGLGNNPPGYAHDKLVKIWNEIPLPDEVKALLALTPEIITWWDPLARGWGAC